MRGHKLEKTSIPGDRAGPLRVFISYSRTDEAIALEVMKGLEYDGSFEVLIDRTGIEQGELWRDRLKRMVEQADAIAFLLSPRSAVSEECSNELSQAEALSKRVVPVLIEQLGATPPPAGMSALNYVRLDGGRSFMDGMSGLRRALRSDLGWLREHTRLLQRALEWDGAGRKENRMLTGPDVSAAQAWLDQTPRDAAPPTELHRDFINASQKSEAARLSADRKRAQELGEQVKRTQGALRIAIGLGTAAVAASIVAAFLWQGSLASETRAVAARDEARRQQGLAESSSRDATKAKTRAEGLLRTVIAKLPASWPKYDADSPDYAHLAEDPSAKTVTGTVFQFSANAVRHMLEANGFRPQAINGKIILILRGAMLADGSAAESGPSIKLRDVRPDHLNLRSVALVVGLESGRMDAFAASSEPNDVNMRLAAAKEISSSVLQSAHLVPTGMYRAQVGTYLRNEALERQRPASLRFMEKILVRRTSNDLTYDTTDEFDGPLVFGDYFSLNTNRSVTSTSAVARRIIGPDQNLRVDVDAKSAFASTGGVKIGGQFDRTAHTYSGPYASFLAALGVENKFDVKKDAPSDRGTFVSRAEGAPVDIVILTGLDAAVSAARGELAPSANLRRLRFGSTGDDVRRLQTALGVKSPNGRFDGETMAALALRQREKSGDRADGILSPAADADLALCVWTAFCKP